MKWMSILILALFVSSLNAVIADEYLLVVETLGYQDALPNDKNPKEALLGSIETTVKLNSKFRTKIKSGNETINLTGELKSSDGAHFDLVFVHSHSIYPIENNQLVPIGKRFEARSSNVTLKLDEPFKLGPALECVSYNDRKEARVSGRSLILKVTKYDPIADAND